VFLAAPSAGNNKPANTPMIAITTSSSMSVKAPDLGSLSGTSSRPSSAETTMPDKGFDQGCDEGPR
jgi:hypothetical protein